LPGVTGETQAQLDPDAMNTVIPVCETCEQDRNLRSDAKKKRDTGIFLWKSRHDSISRYPLQRRTTLEKTVIPVQRTLSFRFASLASKTGISEETQRQSEIPAFSYGKAGMTP
jgi:hypothetical protein